MENSVFSMLVGVWVAMSWLPKPGTASSAPQPALVPAALVQPAATPAAPRPSALKQPPVSVEAAKRARDTVKHETSVGENGGTVHRYIFPDGTEVQFSDRSKRPRDQAQRDRVVSHVGTESAKNEPESTFAAAGREFGLTPEAVTALRFISAHEGGFDAINTWDRARFSWGFIQFAGGYGLRPALGHFKEKSPELFRQYLGDYGVDVGLDDDGKPEPLYVSPRQRKVLRGNEAEQAYGDNPLVIALFIRAGRVTEIKQRQIEAAIRDYAGPALTAQYNGRQLSSILRSPQALAMLIDRKVHEGNVGRLEWALEHAWIQNNVQNPNDWHKLESTVLDLAIRDADARGNIAELVEQAASDLANGRTERLPEIRQVLDNARSQADYGMVVSFRRDALRNGLTAVTVDLMGTPTATQMDALAGRLRELISPLRFEYAIRNRLRNIRTSGLPGPTG